MERLLEEKRSTARLAENIANVDLRRLYTMVVDRLRRLHPDVRMDATSVEIRFRLDDTFFCRLVPYRELLHFQIGDSPMWEIRARDEKGCLEALDKCLEEYLRLAAKKMSEIDS